MSEAVLQAERDKLAVQLEESRQLISRMRELAIDLRRALAAAHETAQESCRLLERPGQLF